MFQFTWVLLPLVAPVLLLPPLLWILYQNRDHPRLSVEPVMVMATSAVLWSLSDAARIAATDPTLKRWLYTGYFVNAFLVIGMLYAFAVDYSDNVPWRRPRRWVPLFSVFGGTELLAIFDVGNLTFRNVRTVMVGGTEVLAVDWGPMFYAAHLVAYGIVGLAAYMFLSFEQTNRHYRGQVMSILAAAGVPWALNVAYLAGVTTINYTGLGFAASLPLASLMIFRYRVLDIVPVARTAVVDEMETGFLVLDYSDTVVDTNEQACDILGVDSETLLGKDLDALALAYPPIADAHNGDHDHGTLTVDRDGETRHYQVDVSRVTDQTDEYRGFVVLFQDVSRLVEARRKLQERSETLEEQNERLEDFAHMVSHDLRNPLSIARGQLELARMEHEDDDRLEKVADAHERIDELIDDVLALARQGQAVTEPERLALPEMAREAWENVDTRAATLDVPTDAHVSADRSQLSQLFENLFRNAVQHGGDDVAVTVDTMEGGFYVEDDGPGIPEDERDDVLQKGYTTDADGTGMGLTIIQTAADAHGWDVAITEGTEGGARFEFTDVETDPDQPSEETDEVDSGDVNAAESAGDGEMAVDD